MSDIKTSNSVAPPSIVVDMARYINPYTDFGFKKLFGVEANKDLLQDFLQTLLNVECDVHSGIVRPKPKSEQMQITSLHYLNAEQMGRSAEDRKAVFDIYCETSKGEKIIVEMQRAYQEFFKDRSVFYATFPIREQAKKDRDAEGKLVKWNFQLKAVYTVAILDFVFKEDSGDKDKYLYKVQLSDTETHEVFYDKLTFIYMEMPKFKKTEAELVTNFDKWMYAIKYLSSLSARPAALQDRIFKKFFEAAEIEQLTAGERRAYDMSMKTYWDYHSTLASARLQVARQKDKVIAEKDEVIAEKEKALAEKDAEIAKLKQLLNKQ
jgi:predicted transposase/invertase (TIGR01784 family)